MTHFEMEISININVIHVEKMLKYTAHSIHRLTQYTGEKSTMMALAKAAYKND